MTGSNTITVRPAHVQTERVHDYLYDKGKEVITVGSKRPNSTMRKIYFLVKSA